MSTQIDRVLKSRLLGREVSYRVLFPDESRGSEPRYPVLYLLHGLFGSFENWTDLTDLSTYIDSCSLMIVMPEGGDGWYTDAGEANESYLIEELIPEIDGAFKTVTNRTRSIAGNSMGGYGAFKFALKYPELFGFAGSFSGAFHAPKLAGPSENANWEELGPSVSKVFGSARSEIREANDIERILGEFSKDEMSVLPYFYFDCGMQDGFLGVNREMDETFSSFGVSHEYHEFEGGHDWQYWDNRIRDLLDLLTTKFQISGSK